MIEITSKRDGFRRAGMAHSAAPKRYPDGTFTAEQLRQLEEEPMLTVRITDDEHESSAAKTAGKAKAKK